MTIQRWFFEDYYPPEPSLEEQGRLADANAAALADPNYVDPWGEMLEAMWEMQDA